MGNYLKFHEIEVNESITTVALVTSIEETTAKNQTTYCKVGLSDGEENIVAKVWQMRIQDLPYKVGDLIGVQLNCQSYQDKKSFIITSTLQAPASEQISDYIRSSPFDPEKMYREILDTLAKESKGIPKGALLPLSDLVRGIYEENKEQLLYWSAAKSVHHNIYGGLLYHTYLMFRTGRFLVKGCYVYIDKDILLAGLALHDIGKLKELDTNAIGAAEYSVEGSLFGHLFIGVQMVDDYVRRKTAEYGQNPFDPTQLEAVRHIIASHHGKQEYGAITTPQTPEAYMTHMIDDMDAKLYQYKEILDTTEEGQVGQGAYIGRVYHMPRIEYP